MQITIPDINQVCEEHQLFAGLLPEQARILELGCGKAEKTRAIAKDNKVAYLLALETDAIQHAINLTYTDLPRVQFGLGAAEAIPAANASFDIVMMFKSLHHVPLEKLDQAFTEIHRVLKPGGLAYISEPIFAGEYNEILRLFHDESSVRQAAFAAVERAITAGLFDLVEQKFFLSPLRYRDFAQFEDTVIKVTHSQHQLTAKLEAEVRDKFNAHMTAEGAGFLAPIRVDLLRKAA
ncbi:MAG: class I SAM-dependent methyltransferase [Glaciimonas sp.]|nr:class I SAM-dependent methyltransferase [Glaciimonas sp.]